MANIKSILKERREYAKELITRGDSKAKREALDDICYPLYRTRTEP